MNRAADTAREQPRARSRRLRLLLAAGVAAVALAVVATWIAWRSARPDANAGRIADGEVSMPLVSAAIATVDPAIARDAGERLGHLALLLAAPVETPPAIGAMPPQPPQARAPRSAILIGAGNALLVRSVAAHLGAAAAAATLTVVDADEDALNAARAQFADGASRASFLAQPALKALQSAKDRVDVIVAAPLSPADHDAGARCSREFFDAARQRLAPGGVFATAVILDDWTTPTLADALTTVREAFPSVTLWALNAPSPSLAIAIVAASAPPMLDIDALAARMSAAPLAGRLRALSIDTPEDVFALYLCDVTPQALPAALAHGAPIRLADLHPPSSEVARHLQQTTATLARERIRLIANFIAARRRLYPHVGATSASDAPAREELARRLAARANAITSLLAVSGALAAGDARHAEAQLEQALRFDPGCRLARGAAFEWGWQKLQAGHAADVLAWSAGLIKFCPDSVDFRRLRAMAADRDGQSFLARQILEDAARRAPESFAVWRDLGLAYARVNDINAAIDALTTASLLRPEDTDIGKLIDGLKQVPRFAPSDERRGD